MCFQYIKFYKEMLECKIRNLKGFLKQIFEVSVQIFRGKWEGETLFKRFFIFKQFEKSQNGYYPDNLNVEVFAVLPPCNF